MGMLLRRNKSLYEKPKETEKPSAAPVSADKQGAAKVKEKSEAKKDDTGV
jgi:hypothetical protein